MKYFLICTVLLSFQVASQQDPISGMYWNNYSFFNPAMSGVAYKHEANVSFRNQWDKVNGAPSTLFFNYGTNLADKHGLGMNYAYETIGFSQVHRIKLNYNYQLKLDADRKLVLGIAPSLLTQKISPSWVPPSTSNDPSLPQAYEATSFGLDVGVSYYSKKLIAGISATQLPISSNSSSNPSSYNSAVHMYGNLRYHLHLNSDARYFILETQMRTDFVKYSQDFNVGFHWNGILEAGLGYRTSDAVLVNLTGIIAKRFRVGYSYAHTVNKLSSISRGTHEVTLGLRLPN